MTLVIGIFDSCDAAEKAKAALDASGVQADSIELSAPLTLSVAASSRTDLERAQELLRDEGARIVTARPTS